MKISGTPHATIPQLIATPWQLHVRGEPVELQSFVEGWDPSVDLEFRRTIQMDPAMVRETTGLGRASKVRLLAGWYCDATRSRCFTSELDVSLRDDDPLDIEVSCEVAGRDVAVSIALETRLILIRASGDSSEISATATGASLWDDELRIPLEGVASRFPTEWIDFTHAAYPNEAAWYLDWDPSRPEYSVLGGMRLYLNSSHPRLPRLLKPTAPECAVLWQTIRIEIARLIVRGGLASDEFVENSDSFEDETVGAAIRRLVNVVFVGDSVHAARDLMVRDPGRFDAQLQARLGYLQEDDQ